MMPFTDIKPGRGRKAVNELGNKHGKLTVLRRDESRPDGGYWICRCDCGNETTARGSDMRSGHVRSCGCARYVSPRIQSLRSIWRGIVARCTNPKCAAYHRYGGRGITLCDRWLDFDAFRADVGDRPSPLHSIDRIDNDRGYEPGNVRWATRIEQSRNSTAFKGGGGDAWHKEELAELVLHLEREKTRLIGENTSLLAKLAAVEAERDAAFDRGYNAAVDLSALTAEQWGRTNFDLRQQLAAVEDEALRPPGGVLEPSLPEVGASRSRRRRSRAPAKGGEVAMTRREREQVVELLRCAADFVGREFLVFGTAADSLGWPHWSELRQLASDAAVAALHDTRASDPDWVRSGYLEAARRIEEGWTP